MIRLRKSWLAALCLGLVLMLFGQATLCLAEHAGLIGCGEHASQQDPSAPADQAAVDCCHGGCHGAFAQVSLPIFFRGLLPSGALSPADSIAPSGPVREIDLPPQLS